MCSTFCTIDSHETSRGLFATAELLVTDCYCTVVPCYTLLVSIHRPQQHNSDYDDDGDDVWRHNVGDSIPVQNGIVRRVGKFILKMLLLGHQITASGLQRSSVANVEIAFPSVRL